MSILTKRGDSGKKVRHVQEWLMLHGIGVALDGEYGPATEAAVKKFQASGGGIQAERAGAVCDATWAALEAPLTRALSPVAPLATLGDTIVAVAQQHLAQRPMELLGQNLGPWVRAYMKGNEGPPWAWCAGFACFVVDQAAKAHGQKSPIKVSFSVTELAKTNGTVKWPQSTLKPGAVFCIWSPTSNRWNHTGIVTAFHNEHFETIEGNTNEAGSREGIAVMARVRGYTNMDFITIGG